MAAAPLAPSPVAERLPRRRWRDPRLAVGVLLVVLSVVAVVLAIRAADDRVMVWAVSQDVPAGTPLNAGRLVRVPVSLNDTGAYLLADDELPAGATATHDLRSGELLPAGAVATPSDAAPVREVTVPVLRNQMPAELAAGQRVDVYVVERSTGGEPIGKPQLVIAEAAVASVDDGSSAFGGSALEVGVALSVPVDDVTAVLAAQSRGTITLVDVPVGQT